MSASTGPLLAAGAIVMFTETVIDGQGIDWKVPVATGFAIGAFALVEPAAPDAVRLLAYLVLVSALIVGPKDAKGTNVSPITKFQTWFTPAKKGP